MDSLITSVSRTEENGVSSSDNFVLIQLRKKNLNKYDIKHICCPTKITHKLYNKQNDKVQK